MTALVRKTYVISCDHVVLTHLYRGEPRAVTCGVTRQLLVPDESLGAASEWVLKQLRQAGWTYRTRSVGPPQHFCMQHKPAPAKRTPKINNGGK